MSNYQIETKTKQNTHMKKIYVLDTSVVAYDPYCFEKFPDSDIILHVYVLNELDKIKRTASDAGKNARTFIRILDEICALGKIHEGIQIDNNINIKVDTKSGNASMFGDSEYGDNQILSCAYNLKTTYKPNQIVLVSKDINLRIRAQSFDICSQDYEKETVKSSKWANRLYSGIVTITSPELSGKLCKDKIISCDENEILKNILPNECVHFADEYGNGTTLGRRIKNEIHVVRGSELWSINSKNKEQEFAANLLLDPDVSLVSLIGRAGTGKSILAVAAGLELLINQKTYNKIIIYRPMQAVGNELGYLPGNLAEKLEPWMEAIIDSLDFLTSYKKKTKGKGSFKEDWRDRLGQYADKIYLEPITYIRGRSIPNTYMIIDEAQNLSKNEIKTVLTRAGYGTKIVLTGDIEQTDSPHLDAINNGLTHVASAFRGSPIAGHITLVKGERSRLATEASKIL